MRVCVCVYEKRRVRARDQMRCVCVCVCLCDRRERERERERERKTEAYISIRQKMLMRETSICYVMDPCCSGPRTIISNNSYIRAIYIIINYKYIYNFHIMSFETDIIHIIRVISLNQENFWRGGSGVIFFRQIISEIVDRERGREREKWKEIGRKNSGEKEVKTKEKERDEIQATVQIKFSKGNQ